MPKHDLTDSYYDSEFSKDGRGKHPPLQVPQFQEPPPELLGGAEDSPGVQYRTRAAYKLSQQVDWLIRELIDLHNEQGKLSHKVEYLLRIQPEIAREVEEHHRTVTEKLTHLDEQVEKNTKYIRECDRLHKLTTAQVEEINRQLASRDEFLGKFRQAQDTIHQEKRDTWLSRLRSIASVSQVIYFILAILGTISGWVMFYLFSLND